MSSRNRSKIFRSILSVSGIVIFAKILGFVKQVVTANAFGATQQTDLISLSEGLISNLDFLLVQSLITAFVPSYIKAKRNGDIQSTRFVSNTIKVFLVLTVAISCLFIVIAPFIAKILAPSYSEELTFRLTRYIRIYAPAIIAIVEIAVFNALLKANKSFIPGELVSVNQSIIIILSVIILDNKIGPDSLVVGFFGYAIFNCIFLAIYAKRYWRLEKGNPLRDANIMHMLKMMGPLLLGYSMIFVNQQVDKIIVSGLGSGTVTAMTYASTLSNFVNTFVASVCGVLFTYISENVADKKENDAANLTLDSVAQITTLLLPISILTILNANDIVTIVFGRGAFDSNAVEKCSQALIGYGFVFVPYGFRELYSRFQYAYGNSKQPMINSSIAIVFNIIFSIALSVKLGVLGVTIATSISVMICAVMNIVSSHKINKHLNVSKIIMKYLPRWMFGALCCIVVTFAGKYFMATYSPIIRFVIITLISFIGYSLFLMPVLRALFSQLKRKS